MRGASTPTVERVSATALTFPTTDRPEQDGTLTWSSTTVVLVDAFGGGHYADGGDVLGAYSAGATASLVEEHLAPAVVGSSVLDVRRSTTAMELAVRNLGPGGLAAHARSAVDVAQGLGARWTPQRHNIGQAA